MHLCTCRIGVKSHLGLLRLHSVGFQAREKRACTFLTLASLDAFAILATEPDTNVVCWPCNWKETPVGWFTLRNYIMFEHVARDSWWLPQCNFPS